MKAPTVPLVKCARRSHLPPDHICHPLGVPCGGFRSPKRELYEYIRTRLREAVHSPSARVHGGMTGPHIGHVVHSGWVLEKEEEETRTNRKSIVVSKARSLLARRVSFLYSKARGGRLTQSLGFKNRTRQPPAGGLKPPTSRHLNLPSSIHTHPIIASWVLRRTQSCPPYLCLENQATTPAASGLEYSS